MLTGLVVVDLSVGMSGALTGKMLAELGARVLRVTPPGGDPFSAVYPAYDAWQSTKELVGEQTPAALLELLASADACLLGGEDHPSVAHLPDPEELARLHPRLVVLVIAGSPDREVPAHDLLAQAHTGLVWEQYSDRPFFYNVALPTYGAVLQAVASVLGGLLRRQETGTGLVVDASLVQGSLAWLGAAWAFAERPDPARSGQIPKDLRTPLVQGSDGGWVVYAGGGPGGTPALEEALGARSAPRPAVVDGTTFFGDIDAVAAKARERTTAELVQLLADVGVAGDRVHAPGECWDDEQLRENGIIARTPSGEEYVALPIHWDVDA